MTRTYRPPAEARAWSEGRPQREQAERERLERRAAIKAAQEPIRQAKAELAHTRKVQREATEARRAVEREHRAQLARTRLEALARKRADRPTTVAPVGLAGILGIASALGRNTKEQAVGFSTPTAT
jgi:chromosome segregation ATPase